MSEASFRPNRDETSAMAMDILRGSLPGRMEGRLRFGEPMDRLSTFRTGGRADAVFFPGTEGEVRDALRTCRDAGIPVTILGNGSNVVVSDAGIRGLVVVFGPPFASIDIRRTEDGWDEIEAQAGASLAGVANRCAAAGLTGMEFACGIPGTIGGAVFMNAGAYDGCMADAVRSTDTLGPDLRPLTIDAADHRFGYRTSALMDGKTVVLRTRLCLRAGNQSRIDARIAELAGRRRQTQPLEFPSAGSVFKRPQGFFAGKLISDCGLRGFRIGGAQVSEKHAGFIVNAGNASASDIRSLTAHVISTVLDRMGVRLEPEIRFIGEWSAWENHASEETGGRIWK